MYLQAALAFTLLPALAFWPPLSGPFMLIAPPGVGEAELMNVATAGGGTVLGVGPFGGTMIVMGERARMAGAAAPRGILMLGAPFTGCTTRVGAGA